MPKRGGNISLTSYDDIFETDESRAESQLERVQNISISELVPFKDHPFKVVDDEAMLRTMESIAQYGVLTPLIARPLEGGGYEIISGHRRAHAAELAGLTEVPVLVRQMDDDAATVLMVDSNLQRENILPSERAYAYKMKMEAKGMRTFNYSAIRNQKWDSEILGLIATIYKEAGKQELYLKLRPDELEKLVEIAKIQSTEASNAIEGIVTTNTRIRQLVEEKTTPKNRDEQEIAGYRDVLSIIHESYDAIPLSKNDILQLHIREQCPSLSLSSVEAALRKMVASGELKREGTGKSTCYIRLK